MIKFILKFVVIDYNCCMQLCRDARTKKVVICVLFTWNVIYMFYIECWIALDMEKNLNLAAPGPNLTRKN